MFMFRNTRHKLTKQLTRARRTRSDETRRPAEEEFLLQTLLKSLQANQLEMLYRAVHNDGKVRTGCVLLPRECCDREPHVLCCRTWRWPDLQHGDELKRIPCCGSATDSIYICCNPYHWSRLWQPETPPPPYSRYAVNTLLRPEDRAPSEAPLVFRDSFVGSVTTNGEDATRNPNVWCKLAYWEMAQRVGPPFPVEKPFVNVFGDTPHDDGLSLHALAGRANANGFANNNNNNHHQQQSASDASVAKTRCKIGLGVTLSREEDGIWLYNRSEHPIFVGSTTLESAESSTSASSPTRVPAEHCLCVYDRSKAARSSGKGYDCELANRHPFGPVDRNSVRISFVKGWGPGYSRYDIMSCPCWIEILLAPCR